MGLEIERKFIVTDLSKAVPSEDPYDWLDNPRSKHIRQGVMSDDPNRFVRVRVTQELLWAGGLVGSQGYITIKGAMEGFTRKEWEWKIPTEEAEEIFKLSINQTEKVRHIIPVGSHNWEVDVFLGANSGLVLAEVELASEDEKIITPEWVGEEVSTDYRYTNAFLGKHPYPQW